MSKEEPKASTLLERAYQLTSENETLELYKDWAETFDNTMIDGLGYLTPALTARLLSQYCDDKECFVLDVGCGTGLAGEELSRHGFTNIDALDFSEEMLNVAARREVYSGLHQVDLNEPIPIADNIYDGMICTGTFTHAHVGAGCLDELFRILKPGGKLACTVHEDVWEPHGFREKSAKMESGNRIATRSKEYGRFFSKEPGGGWFILWERLA